jgi:hypothetical protein
MDIVVPEGNSSDCWKWSRKADTVFLMAANAFIDNNWKN